MMIFMTKMELPCNQWKFYKQEPCSCFLFVQKRFSKKISKKIKGVKTLKIKEIIEEHKEKVFIQLKHCNFTQAVQLFLKNHGYELEKSDIVEGEKESYIDQYGVFKYKNTIKLKPYDLKMQVSSYFTKEWEYIFDEILSPHVAIKEERIIERNNHDFVLVSYLDEEKKQVMYAVPVSLAEELDLEEFHEKQIEEEVKKEILARIEKYEVKSTLSII